jgi:hypothetical protein
MNMKYRENLETQIDRKILLQVSRIKIGCTFCMYLVESAPKLEVC